jgi:signal peptidase I
MAFTPGSTPYRHPDEPPPPLSDPPPSSALLEGDGEAPPQEAWPPDQGRQDSLARARRVGWELIQTLILAGLIFFAVRAMAQNFRVEGSSMEPGLHNGQYLLVNKAIYFKISLERLSRYVPFVDAGDQPERFLFRGPQRGDVVVFRFPRDPTRDFIKRIIGVPGDTVEVIGGRVSVNGIQLQENYILSQPNYDVPKQIVPAGSYFVLGDNRNNSFDSHSWGFVPEENIIGQAVFSYWPFSSLGGVGNRTINLGVIQLPVPW